MNEKNLVLVCDFDGTITTKDSNDLLFETLGNAESAQIEADFIAGRTNNREAMKQHFEVMRIGLEEYHKFLDAHLCIDPTFDTFLEQVRSREIPLYIVSGGFHQAIERVLGEERLHGVKVLANNLVGDTRLTTSFATVRPDCDKPFGPCCNCKRAVMEQIRQTMDDSTIIYVGDGLTDRCAMEGADALFAKDALAAYCETEGISYIPYADFAEITNYLWDADTKGVRI
ncbi:MAG: MtnX-like HAD-IB family phosphatase [Oscillospiraceae bacterium]|nr:MtnX-like HAD-IB family phosphatase [Oscillospiraceae bacterium]